MFYIKREIENYLQKWGDNMKLNRNKVDIVLARNSMSISDLAASYGCSKNRIYAILNSLNIKPQSAGKMAIALKCDVTDIID